MGWKPTGGHAESHTVASHSDTTGTGAELDELTDGSTTTLHVHAAAASDFSGARVHRATDQSLTEDTLTAIAFTSEDIDSDGYHDNAVNNSRLTVPLTAFYFVTGSALFDSPTGGSTEYEQLSLRIRVDGATTVASVTQGETPGGDNWSLQVSELLSLSSGSYVELMARQRNGSSAAENILGSTSTVRFAIHRVGT